MNELIYQPVAFELAAAQEEKEPQDICAHLEAQSDETLRDLVNQATAILEDRVMQRRRDAIADIRRLAKENGLTVDVKKQTRRRDRPRKAGPAAS